MNKKYFTAVIILLIIVFAVGISLYGKEKPKSENEPAVEEAIAENEPAMLPENPIFEELSYNELGSGESSAEEYKISVRGILSREMSL